jgi:chemotaxis signal transduction protein
MSADEASALARRLQALRQAFDRSFTTPLGVESGAWEDFVVLSLGQSRLAVRLAEISGIFKGPRIVPYPTDIPALLGLAGIKGRLVPVYSLAALLGLKEDPDQPCWLAVCEVQEEALGLAFAGLEGTVRATQADLCAATAQGIRHVREAVHLASGRGYIVDLTSLKTAVKERIGAAIPAREE